MSMQACSMRVSMAEKISRQQQTIIELQAEVARLNFQVFTSRLPSSLLIT